jgi:hypothetical protein
MVPKSSEKYLMVVSSSLLFQIEANLANPIALISSSHQHYQTAMLHIPYIPLRKSRLQSASRSVHSQSPRVFLLSTGRHQVPPSFPRMCPLPTRVPSSRRAQRAKRTLKCLSFLPLSPTMPYRPVSKPVDPSLTPVSTVLLSFLPLRRRLEDARPRPKRASSIQLSFSPLKQKQLQLRYVLAKPFSTDIL